MLYCAQPVSTQAVQIYRQHYKNINFIQFYSYKYNFVSVVINFPAIKSNKIQPDKQDSVGSHYENIKGTEMGSAEKTGWRDVLQEIRGKGKKRGFVVFPQQLCFSFTLIIHIHAWEPLSTLDYRQQNKRRAIAQVLKWLLQLKLYFRFF